MWQIIYHGTEQRELWGILFPPGAPVLTNNEALAMKCKALGFEVADAKQAQESPGSVPMAPTISNHTPDPTPYDPIPALPPEKPAPKKAAKPKKAGR